MRSRSLLGLAALAAVLAACSRTEPAHDIGYYRARPEERATKMAACQTDRGRVAPTANCINALAADSEATSRKFWSEPKPAPRAENAGKL